MKILALTGRAGSGKDTAALLLRHMTMHFSHGYPVDIDYYIDTNKNIPISVLNCKSTIKTFQIAKFAYPVYQIAAVITGHETVEEVMTQKFKDSSWGVGGKVRLSGRELLQMIGTECFRNVIDDGVWISVMDRKIMNSKSPGVIISDLRFLNEAAFIKGAGGIIIRMEGRQAAGVPSHQSETELDHIKADYIVTNNGSYLGLARQLERICTELDILNCKYQWKTS